MKTQVGKYRILRELGRGGMGVVYLAEDTSISRNVAIKVLYDNLGRDEEFRSRFAEEARVVAAIRHPNVIHLNAFGTFDDELVIDNEFMDGGSLFDRLSTQTISPVDAIGTLRPILEALAHCHDQGIIHRDVKPSNILFDSRAGIKLSDFGLAKAYSAVVERMMAHSSSCLFVGTPQYAPPEAWESGEPTPAWDVYSTGVVIHEILLGKLPYTGTTPLALLKQILTVPPPTLRGARDDLSPAFIDVVDRMLSTDESRRIVDARQAIDELMATPEGKAQRESDSATVFDRVPRTRKRRAPRRKQATRFGKWEYVASAALAVAALVAAITVVAPRLNSSPPLAPRTGNQILLPPTPAVYTSKADVLAAPRVYSGVAVHAFDAFVYETKERASAGLLLTKSPAKGTYTLWGSFANQLLALTLSPLAENEFGISGDWAAYRDQDGTYMQTGTVTGTARWLESGKRLLASLKFIVSQTGATWDWTLEANQNAELSSGTRFVFDLEEHDVLAPLLYRELLPRNLSWAVAFEKLLPAIARDRVLVKTTGAEETIVVDGALQEPLWANAVSGGEIAARPSKVNAVLMAREVPNGVALGLRIAGILGRPVSLRLAAARGVGLPLASTETLHFTITGSEWLSQRRLRAGEELPWDGSIRAACHQSETNWEAEVFIPFESTRTTTGARLAERWRMNCALESIGDNGEPVTIAQWGYPDVDDTRHGLVMEFAPAQIAGN